MLAVSLRQNYKIVDKKLWAFKKITALDN